MCLSAGLYRIETEWFGNLSVNFARGELPRCEMKENKIIIYTANDGKTKIDVKLEEKTLWLTRIQAYGLYQTDKSNVSGHISSNGRNA